MQLREVTQESCFVPHAAFTRARAGAWLMALLLLLACAGVAAAQTVTTLYNFDGSIGSNPGYVNLAQARDGLLYGTTYNGGANGFGSVFKVDTAGNVTNVYSFTGGTDGSNPSGGLTLATDGNLYGTTQQGGSSQQGALFKITTAGVLTVLHSFTISPSDGGFPYGPPTLASDQNLYGATSGGGTSGNGTVYKVTTAGVYSVIYNFDYTNGAYPIAPPLQAGDGLLYAPAVIGGNFHCGVIVKLTLAGALNSSYHFPCSTGAYPVPPLYQGSDGNLYGTTQNGGSQGEGVFYRLSKTFAFTLLHTFGSSFGDGSYPDAGVIQATDGKYYGAAAEGGTFNDGTLYSSTAGGASFNNYFSFDNSSNLIQAFPFGAPTQHTSGKLYGATQLGGSSNAGLIYSVSNNFSAFCQLVLPTAKVGNTIQILGQGFTGTSSVTINGQSATFRVVSDTYLTATVPTGATSGFVVVTTPGGTLTSNKKFTVKL